MQAFTSYARTRARMYVCMHSRTHARSHECVRTHAHTRARACTYACSKKCLTFFLSTSTYLEPCHTTSLPPPTSSLAPLPLYLHLPRALPPYFCTSTYLEPRISAVQLGQRSHSPYHMPPTISRYQSTQINALIVHLNSRSPGPNGERERQREAERSREREREREREEREKREKRKKREKESYHP